MNMHHRQEFLPWWPLVWFAALALAPGCSGSSGKGPELVEVRDSRGIVTYRYAGTGPRAGASSNPGGLYAGDGRQADAANGRRPQDDRAYQDARREREDRWRQEQQQRQADQDDWRRNQQEQQRLQREEQRLYEQQQRNAMEEQRRRYQAEAWERQRASQELDAALQRNLQMQQQQRETTFPNHSLGR